jgi:glycyl-tRNA synthetase beta chain
VRNILKQAGETAAAAVDEKRFEHPAEKALHARLGELARGGGADYAAKLQQLATLREPVDAFFEAVMVNAEDPAVRNNRLALLRALDSACREVADISCLPG